MMSFGLDERALLREMVMVTGFRQQEQVEVEQYFEQYFQVIHY